MKIDSKNQTFNRVENFDIEALRQAFNEGRLYVQPRQENPEELRERGIHSILEYVSRIDDCTSSIYRTHIRAIWTALLTDETFSPLFFFSRYASNRGEVNWYRVNVLICLLREHDVYQSKLYTGVSLHLRCERAARRNTHYTCMNRYLLEHHDMVIFKRILHHFENSGTL